MVERLQATNPSALEAHFKAEYDSLAKTFPSIRPLPELVAELQDEVFDELNVVEINGTKDAEKKVNWKATRYWILVGGAKLDRGYTVEGLCTTYMPRSLGTSAAADTLQQRARFFGYKASYLGLCRVFLQPSVKAAFAEYVEHEEFVREALKKTRGQPLSQWRRDFILTQSLKPTRSNVIGLPIRRIPASGWLVPSALQHDDAAAASNRGLLASVVPKWVNKYGKPVNASTVLKVKGVASSPHDVIEAVPLRAVLEDFLLDVQVRDPGDAEQHSAILIALSSALKSNETLKVDVFLMNKLVTGYRTRADGHGLPADHRFAPINQYFSQSPGMNDRGHCFDDRISLQLRKFHLGTHQREPDKADVKDVTWFALHIPREFYKTLIIEERT